MVAEHDSTEDHEQRSESASQRFADAARETEHDRPRDGDSTEARESSDDVGEHVVIGDPERLSTYWEQQQGDHDCDIYAEGTSLKAFERPFDPEKIAQQGNEEGTYGDDGTRADALGRIWEREGLEVERFERPMPKGDPSEMEPGRSQDRQEAYNRLEDRLENGKAVIAHVDTGPIWSEDGDASQDNRGHALWVTGIERSKSGEATSVICNDSGREDGREIRYPIESFDQAWSSTGYHMVATRDSIPDPEDR